MVLSARSAIRIAHCATRFCALLAVLSAFAGTARAADPQAYSVDIQSTGQDELDQALHDSSLLVTLAEKAPTGPFALVARAKGDVGRLETALQAYGYYQGHVAIEIAGRKLDDPQLPNTLDAMPDGKSADVKITENLGPLYRLRRIAVEGNLPEGSKIDLAAGQPAIAADVLYAGTKLQSALQESGYPLAKVDAPIAWADDDAHVLDVIFKADAGKRAKIGVIHIDGLKDVNEDFVRKVLTVHTGDLFRPSKIEDARQALVATNVFSGVEARAADHLDPDGTIAITFDMKERKMHSVAFTGAYSTDLGISLSASWSHRNLFGSAEQLNLSAAGNGLGGSATNALGYNLTAQYIEPMFLEHDQVLELDLGAVKQDLDAYNQTAITAGAYVRRKFSALWTGSIGLSAITERIGQEGVDRDYQIVGLPLTATYDSTGLTDPLLDPTRGARAQISLTPTHSFGTPSSNYIILQAAGSTYFDLSDFGISDKGRSVLALRALVASVQGASQFGIPPDQRLYAGGSGTVRGYDYQSIGPQFPDGNPIGGLSAEAATIEFRQRLFEDFGAVAFVDAGQASDVSAPFTGTVRVGTGVGVRYYTPIGPLRLDVAVPLNRAPKGAAFGVYIGLGQAF
ncbi:MAG TPA: BamA/TamA family outer membrane protein [Rhizomicrobium sp.]|nr:BamA/TamA family outer membrane protein [Rhizomicrobium sp.]